MVANKKLYNVLETGEVLGIGKNKVYELIQSGFLPAMNLGGLKVPVTAIDKFIETYTGYDFKNVLSISKLEFSQREFEVCSNG